VSQPNTGCLLWEYRRDRKELSVMWNHERAYEVAFTRAQVDENTSADRLEFEGTMEVW